MPSVILVRHGESEINAANRVGQKTFCGQFDTPLTKRGRQQARDLGLQLEALPGLRIDWAVSSCLSRAVESLRLVVENLSSLPTMLPPMAGFNERSLGTFEGRPEADVFREFPAYRDHPEFRHFRNHFQQRAPGGENLTDVTRRMWSTWQDVRQATAGNVLIVSHATALQAWLGRALGLAPADVQTIKIPNATPIILEFTAATDDSLPKLQDCGAPRRHKRR